MSTDTVFDENEFQRLLTTSAIGRSLVYRQSVESTMPLAVEQAASGASHGTIILAEEQTAGRGRRGRGFHSPSGENLYFTFILRLSTEQVRKLPLVVPLAVSLAATSQGLDARIKWPNDIWVGDRKLSGMLIDVDGSVAYPGIGINVNGDPTSIPELKDVATSFGRELGRPISREVLLAEVCNRLEFAMALSQADLHAAYAERSMILGRRVTVWPATRDAGFEGVAISIDDDGTLVVERADGMVSRVTAADVSVRPAD